MDRIDNTHITNADRDAIEALIDRIGLSDTVELLAEIASAKADHIREAWQDETTAASWDDAAGALLSAARDKAVRYASSYRGR